MKRSWMCGLVAVLIAAGTSTAQQVAPQPGPPVDPVSFRYRRTVPAGSGLSAIPLDAAVLAHSRVGGAFADLRLVDGANRQVPYVIAGGRTPLSLPLTLRRVEPQARELKTRPPDRRSVYVLDAPLVDLPAASLVLETTARDFTRHVSVGLQRPPDRRHREAWFDVLATGSWAHGGADGATEPLTLAVPATAGSALVVAVDEGDNSPLPLTAARLLMPAYRMLFYHPGAPLLLLYGNENIRAPSYDLAMRTPPVAEEAAAELAMGPEEDTHGQGSDRAAAVLPPSVFWGALVAAVVVLAGLLVRLLKARES